MKSKILLSLEEAQVPCSDLRINATIASHLTSKLSELYSTVCFADSEPWNFTPPVSPFYDWHTKKPTRAKKLYQAAFIAKDFYVFLKKPLEEEGFIVKPECDEVKTTHIMIDSISQKVYDLPYFPGITYVFIPRK